MKFLAVMLLSLFLCSDSYADVNPLRESIEEIHDSTLKRFKYTEASSTEEFKYYGSRVRVRGDCDDFVSAAYYQLWKRDYDPIVYAYDDIILRGRHVIVCAKGFCLDNNNRNVFPEESFFRRVRKKIHKIVIQGRLREESMFNLLFTEEQDGSSVDIRKAIL